MAGNKNDMDPIVNCLEAISLCRANCCSNGGGVALTPEEVASGLYETELLCIEKKEKCEKSEPCFHKVTQVRTRGKLCFYLGEDYRCSIYEKRPKICVEYHCGADGWKKDTANFLKREEMRLSPGLVFALNPHRTIKETIIPHEGDKIYFLIRDTSLCADAMVGGGFEADRFVEADIMEMYRKFDGEKTLEKVQAEVAESFGEEAASSFRSLVVLWAGQKLLLQKMR